MWFPRTFETNQPRYRAIADAIAQDIANGTLMPGGRMPTVRQLAQVLQVTTGTVLRAYELAERRGLVSREVGRGTFVRLPDAARHEQAHDRSGLVDLSRNEPPHIDLEPILREALARVGREGELRGILEYGEPEGFLRHREILAQWLQTRNIAADPSNVLITGGAQQALTIAIGALTVPGDTVAVEAFTYPGIRNLARLFGLNLAPVLIDGEGMRPEAFEDVCRQMRPKLVYCMPHAHNPTACTYGDDRRDAIAAIAQRFNVLIIEDDVNLRDPGRELRHFTTICPATTIYISSLSKVVAPGLRVGTLVAPRVFRDVLLAASQTTSWMSPPLMAEIACAWIADGTARELADERIRLSRSLQADVADSLKGLSYHVDPDNPHIWLVLGEGWRADEFAERCGAAGVLVASSTQFAMRPGLAPEAVRLCLTNLAGDRLRAAVSAVGDLARARPGPARFQM